MLHELKFGGHCAARVKNDDYQQKLNEFESHRTCYKKYSDPIVSVRMELHLHF